MIGRLTGQLEPVTSGTVIVDVGGVGYEVRVPTGTGARAAEDGEVTLHIFTAVREDAIDLYGFESMPEKELFSELTSVSRVGPKKALRVLSDLDAHEVVRAVESSDVDRFTHVKGIGEKTAQRLILGMKDSLSDFEFQGIAPPDEGDGVADAIDDLRSALSNLGYEGPTIDAAVEDVEEEIDGTSEIEELVRRALTRMN
ncbi:MAG: Holliday junction branch migration protein RuvA [Bradymonadaceae bacterium]